MEFVTVSRKIRQLIEAEIKNQPHVKLAEQTDESALVQGWLTALAFFFAGVFYFYAYYFWGNWGAALTGG